MSKIARVTVSLTQEDWYFASKGVAERSVNLTWPWPKFDAEWREDVPAKQWTVFNKLDGATLCVVETLHESFVVHDTPEHM